MEKIRIGNQETLFEIVSIRPISENIMQLIFTETVPTQWGDITIYTADGTKATLITGYETMFRDEGQTVYLSNDGSVYSEPETPEGPGEPPEPYVPTLGEMKATKRREISVACQQIIYQGVNVPLSDGNTDHFALTIEDQLNLFGKQIQVTSGAAQIEYHADGQPCRYYTATDMQAIITTAMWHVSYHTTYCNAINMWITGCTNEEEVQSIFYGADVPPEYQSEVLKSYLNQISAQAGGIGDGTNPA
ncbi:MAG: acyl carrier protein [Clostridiales bacterium]|nr:acyl carrier protein [Clostridiales bacterium]